MNRQAQSQRLIEYWQQSSQSQKVYCEQQELNYHQFTYWRRKLSQGNEVSKHQPSTALIPVTYTPTAGLSLSLPNGMELRGLTSDNLPLVEQLLERLR